MVLLKALKKLDDKDIYCFICGRGNLKNTLQEFIDKNNMNENIKLLGLERTLIYYLIWRIVLSFLLFKKGCLLH